MMPSMIDAWKLGAEPLVAPAGELAQHRNSFPQPR